MSVGMLSCRWQGSVLEEAGCPVIGVRFLKPTAAPTPGVLAVKDSNFDVGSPQCQSLQAGTARTSARNPAPELVVTSAVPTRMNPSSIRGAAAVADSTNGRRVSLRPTAEVYKTSSTVVTRACHTGADRAKILEKIEN